jgi:hypothetical protein
MRKGGNYTFADRQPSVLAWQAHDTANCYGQPEKNAKNER